MQTSSLREKYEFISAMRKWRLANRDGAGRPWQGGRDNGNGRIRIRFNHPDGSRPEVYRSQLNYFDGSGRIPDGDVHHLDFDEMNDDYSNLVCITKELHAWVHEQMLTCEQRQAKSECMTRWNRRVRP